MAPLRRARLVALVFAVLAPAESLVQLDVHISALGLLLGVLALGALVLESVVTWRGRCPTWWGAALAGPLVVAGAQAFGDRSAVMILAVSTLAGHSLYGPARMAMLRALSVAASIPALVFVSTMVRGVELSPKVATGMVPVLLLLAALLRAMYGALRNEQDAAARDAVLAAASRALLSVTSIAQTQTVMVDAVLALRAKAPGFGVLVVDLDGDELVVRISEGLPGLPVGRRLVVDGTARDSILRHVRHTRAANPPRRSSAAEQKVFEFAPGAGTQQFVVVHGPSRKQMAWDVVDALSVQVDLVRANLSARAELTVLAHDDSLTAIANRATLFRALGVAVDAAAGDASKVALLVVDIDDFKTVNDTLGHAAGDQVLVTVAQRMIAVCPDNALAARFGGDEFAVLMTDVSDAAVVDRLAEALRAQIAQPISWQHGQVSVGVSIGVTSGAAALSAGDLMRCADIAMYSAKAQGKNRVTHFRSELHGAIGEQRTLEQHLPHAIARREIALRYQPIVALGSRRWVGCEAVVGWHHPTLGDLSPDKFVGLAAHTGDLAELSEHLVSTALQDLSIWSETAGSAGFTLAIRVEPQMLLLAGFDDILRTSLRATGVNPGRLTVRVAESHWLLERDTREALHRVLTLGIAVAIDNFVGNVVPLACVLDLGLRQLTVTRDRVERACATPETLMPVVVSVANTLGIELLAESVASDEDVDWAQKWGITIGQGPLLSPTRCAADIAEMLAPDLKTPVRGSRGPVSVATG